MLNKMTEFMWAALQVAPTRVATDSQHAFWLERKYVLHSLSAFPPLQNCLMHLWVDCHGFQVQKGQWDQLHYLDHFLFTGAPNTAAGFRAC